MRITNLKPLISEEAIQTRVKEMAGEISILYKDEPLVVVCVLKGAFMFFSDLVRHLTCKPELDFVRLASYGSAAQRSKTGHSMDFLYRQFQARGARSLRLAVLVDKNERREVPVTSHFVGFTLPSGFVVGYGLDYAESYRELPAIYEAEIEE